MSAKNALISAGASATCFMAMSTFQKTWDSAQEFVTAVRRILPKEAPQKEVDLQQLVAALAANKQQQPVIYVGGNGSLISLSGAAKITVCVGVGYCVLRLSGHRLNEIYPVSRKVFDTAISGLTVAVDGIGCKVVQLGKDMGILRQNMNERFNKVDTDIAVVTGKVDTVAAGVQRVDQNVSVCKQGIQLLCQVVAETLVHHPSPSPAQQALRSFSSAALLNKTGGTVVLPTTTTVARVLQELEMAPQPTEPDSDDSEQTPRSRELSPGALARLTAAVRRVAESCNQL